MTFIKHNDFTPFANTQTTCQSVKKYDYAISLVKFLATFFVLNSHMEICYPKYSYLATGGAFGNALFFFISGFTLFLGRKTCFADYYKRRISRIYPVVLAVLLVSTLLWNNNEDIISGLTHYWFINCIIIYYAIFWICRYYNMNMLYVALAATIISILSFTAIYDFQSSGVIYGDQKLRYILYFGFMSQGAYMGVHREGYKCKWWHTLLLVISFISWYAITFSFGSSQFQLFSIISLYIFCYSIYICGKAKCVQKIITSKFLQPIIIFCGGLCLEVYLIQRYIFTTQLNSIFPVNIPIIMILVVLSAYVLSILGKLISQTFKTEPYDWKAIIKI